MHVYAYIGLYACIFVHASRTKLRCVLMFPTRTVKPTPERL